MKKMMQSHTKMMMCKTPFATARIHGNDANPYLTGTALFYYSCTGGILIQIEVFHLPDDNMPEHSGFFGFHMHEYGDCTPPFDQTGNHYNPSDRQHPFHAGDFPPLLSNQGYAWMSFYDARLSPCEVIGKSLVIHTMADDFTTQPSGHSGDKIGCGVIKSYECD